jgi:hypothetical protein
VSILSAIRQPEPAAPTPIMIERAQMVVLGTIGKRTWFTLPGQPGELELLEDAQTLADAGGPLSGNEVYIETWRPRTDRHGRDLGQERRWIQTKRWPAGTFANGGKAPRTAPVRGRKSKPARPVDLLRRYWLDRGASYFSARQGRDAADMMDAKAAEGYIEAGVAPASPAPRTHIRPARPAPRGPAAMIAYLERRGIKCYPTIDGNFSVDTAGARLDWPTFEAIKEARPLLRAFLHGSPLRCALPRHTGGGEPPEAVSVNVGGAAMCADCAGR